MVNWSVDLNFTFEIDRLVIVKCKMFKPYNDNVAYQKKIPMDE